MRNSRSITRRELLKKGFQVGLVLTLGNTLTGCLKTTGPSRDYGLMRPNAEVTKTFENCKFKDNYTYYWTGVSEDSATAILGVDNRYKLADGECWHEFDPRISGEKIIKGLKDKANESSNSLYGWNVNRYDGKDLGDMYSTGRSITYTKGRNNNSVFVYTPDDGGMGGSGGGDGGGDGGGSGGSE